MTAARRAVLIVLVLAAAAAAGAYVYLPNGAQQLQFQGWVEAYLIFVSPDEAGRVETLSVREGDEVAAGAPLFALDADLQKAAVAENEAAVINARHAYERAKTLLKGAVGTQKNFDDAEASRIVYARDECGVGAGIDCGDNSAIGTIGEERKCSDARRRRLNPSLNHLVRAVSHPIPT